ncbi:MAG TPA: hypothetical protein VHE30_13935 [Polyangiaceae bacterium]|nr:hypothetical protein [Polyangiaceae bacterium]
MSLVRRSGAVVLAVLLSACGSGHSARKAIPEPGDGGPDSGPGSGLSYFGSSGPSGGIVMKSEHYVLFSVTGEIPGSSGLTKSPNNRMVGGVVGRASY